MKIFLKKHKQNLIIMGGALVIGLSAGGLVGGKLMNTPHTAALIANTMHNVPNTAQMDASFYRPFDSKTLSGNYLASRYAQDHHDWKNAAKFLDIVLTHDPDNDINIKRAMVLAMGAGNYDDAFGYADIILQTEPQHPLALMFAAAKAFQDEDYARSKALSDKLSGGGLSAFIKPLMQGWSAAAQGTLETQSMKNNNMQSFHAMLIANYLQDDDALRRLLSEAINGGTITPQDTARIADMYAHIGETQKAITLYETLGEALGENEEISARIQSIKAGEPIERIRELKTPSAGLALAMLDMANLLFQDLSDDSARIFAHMALYLKDDLTQAKLLLADISARNNQYARATAYYQMVAKGDEHYIIAQRKAAAMLEDTGEKDEAITLLTGLSQEYDDVLSQILIGDLHRNAEEFPQAIRAYNKAQQMMGGEVSADYWHLHYRRGMAYERAGKWKKAEADLKTALEFRPNDPYVLNYLAYSWADQGIHLEKSLTMLRKAFALRPADGYISDSLGWVLYRMGRVEEGLPYLEKSSQLLPYDPTINDHLGDAYWRIGRKLEARFQWTRAKNHSDDAAAIALITDKLESGLPADPKFNIAAPESAPGQTGIIVDSAARLDHIKTDEDGS